MIIEGDLLTKSAMMLPVLFLLPILLFVAQAEPSGKWLLINTVDDKESGGRADDYRGINIGGWNHGPWWTPVRTHPVSKSGDPCISITCNAGDYTDYQTKGEVDVRNCCTRDININGPVIGR